MAPKDSTTAESDSKPEPVSDSKVKNGKKGKVAVESDSFLSKFRPRKRFSVFAIFLSMCISIALFYNTCDVRKKKQDCGYSGITPLACMTTACFTKGGGELEKRKITIKRKKGTKFGIMAGPKTDDDSWVFVKGIREGAVADHNANLPADSEDMILPGDSVSSIDGASGKSLRKSLSATDKESVSIEIRRTKLPNYLRWIHQSSKVNFVEKLLTAPGFKAWFDSFSKMGSMGVVLWFFSGYPVASLPFYYLGLSGAISWHMTRCCHDQNVKAGEPHCYKGGSAKFSVAMTRLQEKAEKLYAKVQKKPKSYVEWLFVMPDLKAWL